MKFKLNAKRLKQALQIVEAVIPARTALPAATHVRLSIKNERLTLTTTNIHTVIQYTFGVIGATDGVAVVPAKKLLDFIKTLSDEELEADLNPNNQHLKLNVGSILLEMPTLDDAEFPMSKQEAGPTFVIKQSELREAIRLTAFAAEQNTDRYILNGCYLAFTPTGTCQVLATDSRRLALYSFNPDQLPDQLDKLKLLIPSAVASILQNQLIHQSSIKITLGGSQVSMCFDTVEQDNYYLQFSQIEGTYPDCRGFLPKTLEHNSINRLALLLALKRAISIADADGKVQLKFHGTKLEVEARASSTSVANNCFLVERIPMEYKGPMVTIAFTAKLLAQALDEIDEELISFNIDGDTKPLILHTPNYLYMNMPLRS